MASVGHIAAGMAAARIYRPGRVPTASSMVVWSTLSLLPDIDVIDPGKQIRLWQEYGRLGLPRQRLIQQAALGVGMTGCVWLLAWLLSTLIVA
jgi:hypothetical protein